MRADASSQGSRPSRIATAIAEAERDDAARREAASSSALPSAQQRAVQLRQQIARQTSPEQKADRQDRAEQNRQRADRAAAPPVRPKPDAADRARLAHRQGEAALAAQPRLDTISTTTISSMTQAICAAPASESRLSQVV